MRKYLKSLAAILLVILISVTVYHLSQPISMRLHKWRLSKLTSFDVIVVGTDPEGIAAAVSSARNGLTTLLVDHRDKLGGLWTLGGLNFIDMSYEPHGGLATRGIFGEFFRAMNRNTIGDTKIESFDIQDAENIFQGMTDNEQNLLVKLRTPVVNVVMDGKTITGVVVNEGGHLKTVYAKRVIDATQDADIAAKAGVPYYMGMEDFNLPNDYQPMTLIFEMNGVDWHRMAEPLRKEHKSKAGGINEVSAWGFLEEMRSYKPIHKNIALRGMNIGRQNNGHVLINSLLMMQANPLDKKAKQKATQDAIAELAPIADYLRKRIPGFENARMLRPLPELYVRESRHIVGQYRLSVNDVVDNRNFADKIAHGSYALDIQRTRMESAGLVLGKPKLYSIPFRCLVPKKADNLLVVGRSASYDSFAHGSARVVPVGMATGQAAGVACYYSIRDGIPFYKISKSPDMRLIQNTLKAQGAYLSDAHYAPPWQDCWALKSIRFLRSLGMVAGGYCNDYDLAASVPSGRVIVMALKTERRCFLRRDSCPLDFMNVKAVSKDQAARLLLYLAGKNHQVANPLKKLVEIGIISPSTAMQVAARPKVNNAVWFVMLTDYIHYMKHTLPRSHRVGPHIDRR